MKRRLVVLIGSLLLALSLAACGSTTNSGSGTSSTPPSGAY
jgi:predicted small secreted protein